MAGPAPKTRDWSARENAHKPKGLHVIVHGLVEVPATNIDPVLTESAERKPDSLGLTLALKTHAEQGAQVKVWKSAFFHKEVRKDEFNHVNIRWDHDRIAECAVVNDDEYDDASDEAMVAVNARYGKAKAAKAKPAAKKAAPKKAAVTKAPKQVGGWAKTGKKKTAKKKAAKKASKKAAKKSVKKAKKAPKKSALKKLVRNLVKKLTPKKAKKKKGRR